MGPDMESIRGGLTELNLLREIRDLLRDRRPERVGLSDEPLAAAFMSSLVSVPAKTLEEKDAEIARLREEVEQANQTIHDTGTDLLAARTACDGLRAEVRRVILQRDAAIAERDAAREERDRAVAALRRYGRHDDGVCGTHVCARTVGGLAEPCDCGLDAALSRPAAEPAEDAPEGGEAIAARKEKGDA